MQGATMRASQAMKTSVSSSRSAAFVRSSPCGGRPSASRSTTVKVYARKGQKGRPGFVPGQQEVIKIEQPSPEVDPDNAEFVIFVRATKFMDPKMGVMMNASPWTAITIFKGGQAANYLVKTLENEWGRKLYARTVIRNIGQAVYKEREKIERQIKLQAVYLKSVPSANFEYAMKIRDKSVPGDWLKPEGMTVFPPESELKGTVLDDLKQFFSVESLSSLFSGDSSPAPAETQQQPRP